MGPANKYINPLTDFGFKKLFGTEPNKDLLIDFLNQLLPKAHQIQDLSYAKNEQPGSSFIDRKAIFDLYCIAEDGTHFIVEIQKAKQNYFKERSVFYSTFPIRSQAEKGGWDFNLSAVYTICILDFIFDEHKSDKELLHIVKLKDQECQVFYDKLTYIYLELPKFVKTETEVESRYDKWLYVLKHLAELQDRPKKLQERVFEKLFKAAAIANFSPQERESYEESLKYYRDIKNVVDTSREEGRIEGRVEGRREEKIHVAKKLKYAGVDHETIAQTTGLSLEEIARL